MNAKKLSTVKIVLLVLVWAAVIAILFSLYNKKPLVPEVSYVTIKGETLSAQGLRGKVLLVNFWATSCPACVAEMPKLVDTYKKYQARGFETIAVAMSYDPPNYVDNFAKTKALPFKVVHDARGDIARGFGGVEATPTTFIINKRGEIIREYLGEPDFDELHTLIEKELKGKPG